MAVGFTTFETLQHRFPTAVFLLLFHALVNSHSECFAFKISSTLVLFWEIQMNWALKCVFFCSGIKSSNELGNRKNIIGMRQLIGLNVLLRIHQEYEKIFSSST